MIPTEHSSGQSRSQGGITKTGNGHARRLIEAAWHLRQSYRAPGVELRRRWERAPSAVAARGHVGNRLFRRLVPVRLGQCYPVQRGVEMAVPVQLIRRLDSFEDQTGIGAVPLWRARRPWT